MLGGLVRWWGGVGGRAISDIIQTTNNIHSSTQGVLYAKLIHFFWICKNWTYHAAHFLLLHLDFLRVEMLNNYFAFLVNFFLLVSNISLSKKDKYFIRWFTYWPSALTKVLVIYLLFSVKEQYVFRVVLKQIPTLYLFF